MMARLWSDLEAMGDESTHPRYISLIVFGDAQVDSPVGSSHTGNDNA